MELETYTEAAIMQYTQTAGGSRAGKSISHSGTCDVCKSTHNPIIYDARVNIPGYGRVWAWTCQACFTAGAGSLGVGSGQRYDLGESQ